MDIDTKTLKPGDRVAINASNYARSDYTVAKVERVTPSGQVVMVDGRRFDARGREIGSGLKYYDRARLCPLTEDVRAEIRREAAIARIWRRMEKWEQLPADALEAIEAVLDRYMEPK